MLKKKDLVKEFELVVKQEIVEHNKAITASNLAVGKLRKELEEFKNKSTERFIGNDNRIDSFKRESESILDNFKIILNNFNKLKNDQIALNTAQQNEINFVDVRVENIYKSQTKLIKEFEHLQNHIFKLINSIKMFKECNESEINRVKHLIEKKTKKIKKEILDMPSDSQKFKKELEERIEMHKVDSEGLLKEIKVLKKTVFVNEKHIENLYTVIKRMKI